MATFPTRGRHSAAIAAAAIAAAAVAAAAVAMLVVTPGPRAASAAGLPGSAAASAPGRPYVTAAVFLSDRAATPGCDPAHPTGSLRPTGPPVVSPGSLMARIRARGYLIAGTDLTLYHLSYLSPFRRQVEGFNIDMLHAISTAIFGSPDKIRFVSLQDAARLPAVQSGAVDIVAQPTTVTCARLQLADFSTVNLVTRQRVLVESGSPVRDIDDLGSQKVCGVTGAGSFAELQALAKRPPHTIPAGAPYWTDCLVRLQQGRVAAISGDDAILVGLAAQDPGSRLVGPTIVSKPQALVMSAQHPEFVRFVNAILARMRSGGQWAASYARWIGTPVPAPPPLSYRD